jgi:hypothetical protein
LSKHQTPFGTHLDIKTSKKDLTKHPLSKHQTPSFIDDKQLKHNKNSIQHKKHPSKRRSGVLKHQSPNKHRSNKHVKRNKKNDKKIINLEIINKICN